MYRSRTNGNQPGVNGGGAGAAAYASFLETYFEHVRSTNAMFRSIQDTLYAPTTRTQPHQQPLSGQRAPTRDVRQSTNTVPLPSSLARADDVDYISGVTFNIPIQDNDPITIFNLLSAYASAGAGAGAGAGAAVCAPPSAGAVI
jgi:hypothetical protein